MTSRTQRLGAEWVDRITSVLEPGESPAMFVEAALHAAIAHRRGQKQWLDRARASSENAKKTGAYLSATEVLAKLDRILTDAQQRAGQRS
jgi:hypothetical protein